MYDISNKGIRYIGVLILILLLIPNNLRYGDCIKVLIAPNTKLDAIKDIKHFKNVKPNINFIKKIIQV